MIIERFEKELCRHHAALKVLGIRRYLRGINGDMGGCHGFLLRINNRHFEQIDTRAWRDSKEILEVCR